MEYARRRMTMRLGNTRYSATCFTCSRTGAWRGSVQVPGSSLANRLPTLGVWLSHGLRGPGAAMSGERLERGLPALEVAVPSWLSNQGRYEQGGLDEHSGDRDGSA